MSYPRQFAFLLWLYFFIFLLFLSDILFFIFIYSQLFCFSNILFILFCQTFSSFFSDFYLFSVILFVRLFLFDYLQYIHIDTVTHAGLNLSQWPTSATMSIYAIYNIYTKTFTRNQHHCPSLHCHYHQSSWVHPNQPGIPQEFCNVQRRMCGYYHRISTFYCQKL